MVWKTVVLLLVFCQLWSGSLGGVSKLSVSQKFQNKIASLYTAPEQILKAPTIDNEDKNSAGSEYYLSNLFRGAEEIGESFTGTFDVFLELISGKGNKAFAKDPKEALYHEHMRLVAERGPSQSPSILSQSKKREIQVDSRNAPSSPIPSSSHERSLFNDTICSSLGKLKVAPQTIDTCSGHSCTISEAVCGGLVVTEDKLITFTQAQISTSCEITKIRCYDTALPVWDLSSVLGANSCRASQFYCYDDKAGDQTIQQVTNDRLLDCAVQMTCGNKFVGWDYWAFTCEQQTLVCNGQIVEYSQNITQDILPNCTVTRTPCNATGLKEQTCPNYSLQCVGDITNGCSLQQIQVPCANGTTSSSCSLSELFCNGTYVNASSYLGPLRFCTVSKILCNGQIVNLGSNNCSVPYLTCAGQVFNGETFFGRSDQCTVNQFKCVNNSSCYNSQLVCPGTPTCVFSKSIAPCVNSASCQDYVNVSSCICPIDRTGMDCSTFRAMTCSFDLIYPKPNCNNPYYQNKDDPKAHLLDGDPACLVFSLKENATLRYLLDCSFAVPPDLTPDVVNANFQYWISNDKISISLPTSWSVQFKIFNFNVLSDLGATTKLKLDTKQMLGQKAIWFNTTLETVPSRFWHGNRLYSEATWLTKRDRPPGLSKLILDRRFIDSPEYQSTGTEPAKSYTTLIIVLVLIGVVVLAAIVYIVRRYRKRKAKLELERQLRAQQRREKQRQ